MAGWERSEQGRTLAGGPLDYGMEDVRGQANLVEAIEKGGDFGGTDETILTEDQERAMKEFAEASGLKY